MNNKKRIFQLGIFLILIFSLSLGVFASDNVSTNQTANVSTNISSNIEINSARGTTNITKSEKAFSCLVNELKSDCSGATTIQQLSFSILASPDNVTGKCVNALLGKRKSDNCFGDASSCSIRETSWAILALNHVGKDTSKELEWLIKQNKTSSGVEWFLQQDSTGDTICKLKYRGEDYIFNTKENKKLSGNLGPCFSFAQSNFWLRLNENCFDSEFSLVCDKEFFAGWHYKNAGSPILNVLSETKKTAANNEVKLKVDSKCFGSGSDCNFEDTFWATLALKNQFKDIKPFVPYLISAEDSNLKYLPAAMNYLILEYSSLYGTKLIQQQKSGTYWEAENSAYGSIYDTALALLAIGTQNQPQVTSAKDWIWNFKQEDNGCWNSRNIRDTAFLLWAIEQRPPKTDQDIIISPNTKCEQGGYTCSKQLDCLSTGGELLSNYDCSHVGFAQYCCSKNPIQDCSTLLGEVCLSGLTCSGLTKQSSQGTCCLGECVEPLSKISECEVQGNTCRNSCLTSQEEVDYSCGEGLQVCCSTKVSANSGVPFWLWFLIGILIILIIIAIIFRDRIKVWYYKKINGSKGGMSPRPVNGFGPPRPGFPPLNRPINRPNIMPPERRPMSSVQPPIVPGKNSSSQETFARLKQMTR
jgi:hypothetical protein